MQVRLTVGCRCCSGGGQRRRFGWSGRRSGAYASERAPEVVRKRMIQIVSWVAGFILMIWLLGFLIGMPLFIFLYLKFQARESWAMTSIGTVVAAVFIIGLFDRFMHLPWPLTPLSGMGIPGLLPA